LKSTKEIINPRVHSVLSAIYFVLETSALPSALV